MPGLGSTRRKLLPESIIAIGIDGKPKKKRRFLYELWIQERWDQWKSRIAISYDRHFLEFVEDYILSAYEHDPSAVVEVDVDALRDDYMERRAQAECNT